MQTGMIRNPLFSTLRKKTLSGPGLIFAALATAASSLAAPGAAFAGEGLADTPPASAEQAVPPPLPFGFRGLEIFKVDASAIGLRALDLNGDGLVDLAVTNKSEGSLWLLLQRRPGEMEAEAQATASSSARRSVNEVDSDLRFRIEKVYIEKAATSLAAGDFDGDGKPDLAFYSDPPELEVLYQGESWGARRERFPVRDGKTTPFALAACDLDGDGRDDLVLAGNSKLYLFYQKPGGGLAQPLVLPSASADISAIEVIDLDGDGRLDLMGILPGSESPVLVRLQGKAGFHPEVSSKLRPINAWAAARFPLRAGEEPAATLLTVQESTRRFKAYRWREQPAESGLTEPQLIALRPEGGSGTRLRRLADVDHDGRMDIIISYPETAQLDVHFQDDSGALTRTADYPTLAGVNGLALADIDGDGRGEVLVSSDKEKAIGVSSWKEGRLQFPRTWPLEETPVLLAAGPLGSRREAGPSSPEPSAEEAPEEAAWNADRVFLVSRPEGKGYRLSILRLLPGGRSRIEYQEDLPLKGAAPSELRLLDADGDGATDFLLFVPFEDPYLYRQSPPAAEGGDGAPRLAFTEISRRPDFGIGQLSKLEPPALTLARLPDPSAGGAPALLVAARTFARLLKLNEQGRLEVIEQFPGRSSDSKLAAGALLDLDGQPGDEVVLLDAGSNTLEILQRTPDSTYEISSSMELPRFDLAGLEVCDMDGDGRDDLVILGKEKIGILYARRTKAGFSEVLSYAVDKREEMGVIQDVATGDLNGDGVPDLILNTAPRYNLIILSLSEAPSARPGQLEERLVFRIFEEKSYMRRSSTRGPRQMLVHDIDGDGLEDLVLLIHDRLLLYLQDSRP
jgi:hypothetical protein